MADPVSLGLTIALSAVQMGLQASRKIEGPRLTDRTVSLGDPGDAKNYFLGTRRFESCSFLFAEDLREVKKKRKTKGGKYNEYRYYGTWANHVADHPTDAITRIWLDKHLIFDATGVGPITVIAKGNWKDFLTFYLGGEDQEPDPRMAQTIDAKLGEGSCPAYRGQSYVMFKEVFLEKFGNRLPQPTIEATKNVSPNYPWETFSYVYGKPTNLTLDPSGTFAAWGGQSYEVYDLPSRTLLGSPTFSVPVAGDWKGITSDGRIYTVIGNDDSVDQFFNGNHHVGTFDAASGSLIGSSDTGGRFQDGCVVLKDGNGVEHVLTYGFTSWPIQYGMPLSGGSLGWYEYDFGWKITQYFVDGHGDIWAVGSAPSISPTTTMYLRRVVDTGVRSSAPSSAAFTVPLGAAYWTHVDGAHYGDHFVLQWNGAVLYLIDDETLTVSSSRSFGYAYATTNWVHHDPSQPTIWLGRDEISLIDLSTVRTIDYSDWKFEDVYFNTSAYIPSLHALFGSPQFSDVFTFRYLDRVGRGGVTVGAVIDMISDLCGVEVGDYDSSLCTDILDGFNFTAGAGKSILSPVLEAFDIDPVSEDFLVRFRPRGGASEGTITTGKLAISGDSRFRIPLVKDEDLPLQVTMTFADIDKDQQVNLAQSARAADAVRTKRITQIDMRNLAIDADAARHLADRFMRRQHAEKESHEFSLTDRFLKVTPGSVYTLQLGNLSRIGRCISARHGADRVTETRWVRDNPSLADRGSAAGAEMESRSPEVIRIPTPSRGFVLDVPLPQDALDSATPFMLIAAGPFSPDGYWVGADVYASDTGVADDYDAGWAAISAQSVASWGVCIDALGDALPWLPDNGNSITVDMRSGTLSSVSMDDLLLYPTLNLVLIGREYVQFANATLIAPNRYVLSGFLRGRRGTEQHLASHAIGDSLLVMDASVLSRVMGASEIGDTDYYKVVSQGREEETGFAVTVPFTAAAQKPYSPVHGALTHNMGTGDWSITATRRTRIGGGKIDGQDVPLGETAESWSCDIMDGAIVVHTITGVSLPLTYSSAQQTTDFGAPQTSLSVNLYQVSPVLSLRGFPLTIAA
ncbi:phage tail protein [Sphingobium sp. MI1205]|uniref:phage tail protein n=1 Tax=Sphingobium sp. MI1205 TaxID=407020 RepID=UPI00076FE364|nr:phage tail protein [Sphingobium sp. MI1205]AMK18692.1 hypothetical protein K663_11565 [Sphingobium sp. MI1205]